MTAEIFSIGDEILLGHIVDTNSPFIARELDEIGIAVRQVWGLADDKEQLIEALKTATKRSDLIILTGGLGPTRDDVTKYTLSDFFEDQLVLDKEVLRNIEGLFREFDDKPLTQLNKEQAMVPSKATVIPNEFGTAPGLWLEKQGVVIISLPGVPYEMRTLMEKEIIPRLRMKFKRPFIYHKTLLVRGIRESHLAERLSDFEDELPSQIKLAYLPGLGNVRLRLTARGSLEEEVKTGVEMQVERIFEIIGSAVSQEQEVDEKIAIQISKLLSKNGQTLATAESCTGGELAGAFTTNPGASSCFSGGIVPYDTPMKVKVLGVSQATIDTNSVVSAEVAEEMAARACELFGTDYALSTTGNAGPSKGDSDAPVGTVYIGIATPERVFSRKFVFGKTRSQVVDQTIHKAFELFLRELIH